MFSASNDSSDNGIGVGVGETALAHRVRVTGPDTISAGGGLRPSSVDLTESAEAVETAVTAIGDELKLVCEGEADVGSTGTTSSSSGIAVTSASAPSASTTA